MEYTYTTEEIRDMERAIGHSIPRPYSQTMAEDLHTMSEASKLRGDGTRLMKIAKQVHPEAR